MTPGPLELDDAAWAVFMDAFREKVIEEGVDQSDLNAVFGVLKKFWGLLVLDAPAAERYTLEQRLKTVEASRAQMGKSIIAVDTEIAELERKLKTPRARA